MTFVYILIGLVVLAVVLAAVLGLPDWMRYRRIRKM